MRAGRRLRWGVSFASFAVAACALTGAHAAQPDATPQAAKVAVPHVKLPPPPPGQGWTPNGLTATSKQSVKKAMLSFHFPKLTALAWTRGVIEQPPVYPVWSDTTSYIYVTSPKGAGADFGIFPVKRVTMLGFGTIPVTADVHVTQLTHNGKITPLKVAVRFTFDPLTDAPASLSCQPANGGPGCFYTQAAHLTGPVDIRIDNVHIDNQPLEVGSECHTSSAATLDLASGAGYYGGSYRPKDLYIPFGAYAGGTLKGPVTVPSFTGCHNGGDDLDPLLTDMVSGPGNQLSVTQLGQLGPYPPPAS